MVNTDVHANTMIKSLKELPQWFKLGNYEKSKDLTPDEWYDELMARLCMRVYLKKFGKDAAQAWLDWQFIKRDGLLYHLSKEEKLRLKISTMGRIFMIEEYPSESNLEMNKSPTINSATNLNMYGAYFLNRPKPRDEIAERMQLLLSYLVQKRTKLGEDHPVSDELQQVLEWLGKPFDDSSMDVSFNMKDKYAYARVELEASDEQLKKDFSVWLAEERKRRNTFSTKKNFNEVDMNSWCDSAVLPYLDLMFWSELEGIKIAQYVIAQAIFPDAYALGAEIDPLGKLKTTKKKAEYLMDFDTMKRFELQITHYKNTHGWIGHV